MEPSICASYLPTPLTEDPEGPGSGHQHMQLDLLQIRGVTTIVKQTFVKIESLKIGKFVGSYKGPSSQGYGFSSGHVWM